MTTRLGSILVREGLLTPAQHLEVMETAEDAEQPFVSSLIRLGFVSEDRIVEIFRRKFMVPVASQAMLGAVGSNLIELVPPEMARGFLICPCGEDVEGHLRIAMADPSDSHALDEVTYHTRRRVSRYAALESVLREAIGHHYAVSMGVTPPRREPQNSEEIVLLTKVKVPGRGTPAPESVEKPPVLLDVSHMAPPPPSAGPQRGPEPPPSAPVGPPSASPPTKAAPPPIAANSAPETADFTGVRRKRRGTLLGLPQQDLPHVRDKDAYSVDPGSQERALTPSPKVSVDPSALRPRSRPPTDPASTSGAGLWSSSQSTAFSPAVVKSDAYGEAASALRQASDRDAVGQILIEYFESFFFNVAFLVVRQQRLQGYRGGGTRLKPERVKSLSIRLDERSTFREVVAARLPYNGPLGASPADAACTVQLGYSPDLVSLSPVQIQGKVIGVVYADNQHTEITAGELEALLADVEAAYESIILDARDG